MELCYGRDGSDAIAAELSKLLATGAVYVDEAIHVADAETVDGVWWMALPLGTEACEDISSYESYIMRR